MRVFLKFSMVYLAVALALLFAVRKDAVQSLLFAVAKSKVEVQSFIHLLPWYLGAALVTVLIFRASFNLQRLKSVAYAFLGCLMFSAAFSLIKTTLPLIVPFYSDTFFANLDRAVHFGTDPWKLTHVFSVYLPAQLVTKIYFDVWFFPGLFLPVFLALTDPSPQRVRRFLILYGFCWIVLGNILALLAMSAGPIFYDRLLGGNDFAALGTALQDSGISRSTFGVLQQSLWTAYTENQQAVGSGISAFPSVHVGIATVIALYLGERSVWLAPVGAVFCALILFFSVYVGWHYAVDGYFSVFAVLGAWMVLKRVAKRPEIGYLDSTLQS